MAHKKKMNAAALAAYKAENENFLANLRSRTGIQELRCGVLYKVVQTAPAPPADADERTLRRHTATPAPRSVVTVHYEGRLIDGQVFDSSRRGAGTPPAFRVNELHHRLASGARQHAHRRRMGALRSRRCRLR